MKTDLMILLIVVSVISGCVQQTERIMAAPEVGIKEKKQNEVEGTISGGGGKGVLCKNGTNTSLEVLDLYEAKVLYGLNIKHKPQTQADAIDLAVELYTKHFIQPSMNYDEFKMINRSLFEDFLSNIKFISVNKKLKLINDSFEPIVEENCEMVQVAAYYDETVLIVDQNYWNQMDWMNKIGLISHEIIYYSNRKLGEKNSISSRRLVGALFSEAGSVAKFNGINKNYNYSACYVFDEAGYLNMGNFYGQEGEITNEDGSTKKVMEVVINSLPNLFSLFNTTTQLGINFSQLYDETFNNYYNAQIFIDNRGVTKLLNFKKIAGSGKAKLIIFDMITGRKSEEFNVSCYLQKAI